MPITVVKFDNLLHLHPFQQRMDLEPIQRSLKYFVFAFPKNQIAIAYHQMTKSRDLFFTMKDDNMVKYLDAPTISAFWTRSISA